MSSRKKGITTKQDFSTAKKAAVLGESASGKKASSLPKVVVMAVVVVVVFAAAVFVFLQSPSSKTIAVPAAQSIAGDAVTYEASDFDNGKARFYTYKSQDGLTIRYFILKSSDGVIRAAFDACDVCWPSNKGYKQDGGYMVCNNCGRRFSSVQVNEVKGGCNPSPINRSLENGKVVLKVADILQGRQYFNFPS